MSDLFHQLTDWIDSISGHWWFLGVILVIAYLDAVVPVVPSETVVIIGGVAAGQGHHPLLLVIVAGAVGAFLGDNTGYLIGNRFSAAVHRRAERKPATAKRLEWATRQLAHRGGPLLVTARFVPGGRTAMSLSSGLTQQSRAWFARWVALAGIVWATYAAGLGWWFGDRFKDDHTTRAVDGLRVRPGHDRSLRGHPLPAGPSSGVSLCPPIRWTQTHTREWTAMAAAEGPTDGAPGGDSQREDPLQSHREEPLQGAALREKYRLEREKRLRPDGNDQYLQPTGRFAHFLDDPYTEVTDRAPLTDEVTVAFIGGGFAGLTAGARLHDAGVADFRIIEGGGDVGGVWYWNRYPGAMCDTAAMIYLPLLEETGHMPSQKYTMASEIFEHAQRIATTYDLYDQAVFSTGVTGLRWDETTSRWVISTDRGDQIRARYVGMGTGPLHRPKLPGIDGIETFEGHCFHTSRWDYDYTGGDPAGAPLSGLSDKRVGIIGTGATAVQCIPPLARSAHQLFVFQRTPSSIDIRNNRPIEPEWFSTLEPGWQQEWLLNFATLQTGGFADEDLVQDGWTDIAQRIRDRVLATIASDGGEFTVDTIRTAFADSDDEKMTEIRARVDEVVRDPATAEVLKPWYRQLCKRPCFHDDYLDAFNNPATTLVDTDGQGVERIDATGVWVDGVHYEVDCLIFASGFEVGTDYSRRSGFDVVGRDGRALSDHWAEGMRSLHGMHVHGFPNLFVSGFTQAANLISNITHNLTEAADSMAAVIAHAEQQGADTVEVTAEAEDAWVAMLESNEGGLLGDPRLHPRLLQQRRAAPGPAGAAQLGRIPPRPGGLLRLHPEVALVG